MIIMIRRILRQSAHHPDRRLTDASQPIFPIAACHPDHVSPFRSDVLAPSFHGSQTGDETIAAATCCGNAKDWFSMQHSGTFGLQCFTPAKTVCEGFCGFAHLAPVYRCYKNQSVY